MAFQVQADRPQPRIPKILENALSININATHLVCLLIFSRELLMGPIRYALDVYGIGSLWFIVDIFAIIVTLYYCFIRLREGNTISIVFPFIYILIELAIGYFGSSSVDSVVSGVKMIMPFLMGLVIGEAVFLPFEKFYVAVAAFVLASGGVIFNTLGPYVWENYAVVVGNVEKAATLTRWKGDGVIRLAGFASDDAAAGFTILLPAIFLIRHAPPLGKIAIFLLANFAVYLTTSRTAQLTLNLLLVSELLVIILSSSAGFSDMSATKVSYFINASMLFVIPVLSVIVFNNVDLRLVPHFFDSFIERATITWVEPFRQIGDYFPVTHYLTGVGVGMAGYPVRYSEALAYMNYYFDNFALGCYLMFGLPGVIVLLKLIYQAGLRATHRSNLVLSGLLLFYGMTLDGFGDTAYCLLVGAALSPFGRDQAS